MRNVVEGHEIELTHTERVLWPAAGFSKGQMLDYYRTVAPVLLPHLRDRPVTLGRFPEGVERRGWYQTNCRGHPSWLAVHELTGRRGDIFRMCLVNDLASLVWVVNQGTVELHPLLSTANEPDRPLVLVFDLDPGPPAGLAECCQVALELRERLAEDGLAAWPKASGSLGLHLYVPLDESATFGATRAYARRLADLLVQRQPGCVTASFPHAERVGRVLLDWRQNEAFRSMVAPYSLRATPLPLVSMPLSWREVELVAGGAPASELLFGPAEGLQRIERVGDLFGPVLAHGYALPTS